MRGTVDFHCGFSLPIISYFQETGEVVVPDLEDEEQRYEIAWVMVKMPEWGYMPILVPDLDDMDEFDTGEMLHS